MKLKEKKEKQKKPRGKKKKVSVKSFKHSLEVDIKAINIHFFQELQLLTLIQAVFIKLKSPNLSTLYLSSRNILTYVG